ncbi:SAM-dependent methyltransferase [Sinisalibacter lacisalsi]|uniref:Methyltransferase type 11 n=1 Tax=Sinisalibacter lacisalsi TaxID=1526570 RepID=A0ABQ1QH41_9RHOB|nr:class I SAM-dependent methyltransferase [Sinisalibacter lacisalsi]GGD25527.1 methyltransferase type 11 [Sinisalibacter lacisalsi]
MTAEVFDEAGAAAYYDNDDVATFYRNCWGGADIHIGHYETGAETVADASSAMTRLLIDRAGIGPGDRVLDIACGFGGTLRLLARMGCEVRGMDISKQGVATARESNRAAGLDDRISVEVGDFHDIASADGAWDAVVCQESVIHSPDRPKVFSEAFRVLRPGGVFAFSDILTGENADLEKVEAAFARLGAAAGATVRDYAGMAEAAGFEVTRAEERPEDIRTHYDKLAEALEEPVEGLTPDAQSAIAQSIARWQDALAGGHITWAAFVARKPA